MVSKGRHAVGRVRTRWAGWSATGAPVSDRHRRRSATKAMHPRNAVPPRSAQPARRRRGSAHRPSASWWRGRHGNADLRSAQPAEGGRKRASPICVRRAHGLERRPPVGTTAQSAVSGVEPFAQMAPPARERRPPVRTTAQSAVSGAMLFAQMAPPARERRPPVGTVARSATNRTPSTSCTTGTLPRQSPCRALSGGANRAIRIIRSNTSSHSAVSAASAPPSADPGNGQAAPSSVAAFSRYTLSGRSP